MDRSQMLTAESHKILADLFFWRKVRHGNAKKFAVPIGLRELTIKSILERETKNGKRLVEMRFYYAPSEEMYGEEVLKIINENKISFAPIKSYHVEGRGDAQSFYKRFSTMNTSALDSLHSFKGKKFKGLVKHVANDSMRNGYQLRTEEGWRQKFWTQEVIAVTNVENCIPFDYFDLVDYGFQDRAVKKEIIAPF